MAEVLADLGLRMKKFCQVWLFECRADLQWFIETGWVMSGQRTASAQLAGRGGELHSGAVSLRRGVRLYQLPDQRSGAERHRQRHQVLPRQEAQLLSPSLLSPSRSAAGGLLIFTAPGDVDTRLSSH